MNMISILTFKMVFRLDKAFDGSRSELLLLSLVFTRLYLPISTQVSNYSSYVVITATTQD